MGSFLLVLLSWATYFFLHSFLASNRSKRWFSKVMGVTFRHYRLLYVVFSTSGLFALLFLNSVIYPDRLFDRSPWVQYVSLSLTAFGVIVIRLAFREFNWKAFAGIAAEESEVFRKEGVLRYVRHPIYSGTILIVVGYFLYQPTVGSLVATTVTFAYLPLGIWLEERKLVKQFGDAYREYKKSVPAIIPRFQGR